MILSEFLFLISYLFIRNDPSAEDDIAVIEHRRLTRRDGADRAVEDQRHRAVGIYRCGAWLFLLAIAGLCLTADGITRNLSADPVEVTDRAHRREEFFLIAEDDGILLGVDPHDIDRRADADAEVLALADRVVHDALVPPQHAAVRRKEVARLHRAAVPLDEGRIVAVGDEADILAVGLRRVDKAVLLCDAAHLVLAQPAEGKARMRELFLRQRVEDIALVLALVETFAQEPLAVPLFDSCIVTGGDRVAPQLARPVIEAVELERAVAVDAGIRGDPLPLAVDEFFDDLFFKIILEIENVERDAEPAAYRAGVLDVVEGTAGALHPAFSVIEAHRTADPLMILQ